MPRPGPRPYECIRRAWHSDSHQPLRGALIQEIFRVVNELHSTSTRRKKEWQEKLPIVVLRAEEILYSKANSESEYAGVETLRARLDDAVNTMIRRDDTEEEGVYLVPCVEAALSLGCTPKKVPRGQRHLPSRLSTNSARRNSSTGTTNVGHKAMAGSGSTQMRSVHEKGTSTSLGLDNTQRQDQGLKAATLMEPSCLYSSVGLPLGTNVCHASVFPPAFATPTAFDAACPFTPTLPQLGSLVQFLKGADNMSMPPCHANYDSRAPHLQHTGTPFSRGETQFACREFTSRSDIAMSTADIPTNMSLLPMDTRKMTQLQGMGTAPNTFSADMHMFPHLLKFSATPNLWYTGALPPYISSHLSTISHSTPAPSMNAGASFQAPQACFDDLQLRLGPPGNEASSTSAMMSSNTSAPKRLRVD